MEIGTEISRKIRGAIKGKLQELGAYVDEELPDYIMVMVANKKTQEQMTDDLSLFLGSSTSKFTVWLHGVLEKLRSATSDPSSQKSTDAIIFESSMPASKNVSGGSEDGMPNDPGLSISRTRVERLDTRVATSSLGQEASYVSRQHSEDGPAPRLTSAVKPMRDLAPSEAIIDIQPNADDLIDEDLNYMPENPVLPQKKPSASTVYGTSRPSAALYRPPGSSLQHYQGTEFATRSQRVPQVSIQPDKLADSENCCPLETVKQYDTEGSGHAAELRRTTTKSGFERNGREESNPRRRKLQSVSSVVKVKKFNSDGQEEDEDDEEEDDDRGSRPASLPSSVSVPAKPERRPTLPPCKQANKNLILKAISEAQESVTKTTNYTAVPQKQTVPVAPRTRLPQDDPVIEMIRAQNALSRPSYLAQTELPRSSYITQADIPASNYLTQVKSSRTNYLTSADDPRPSYLTQIQPLRESGIEKIQGTHQRQELFSRLRLDPAETSRMNREMYEEDARPLDSRSFILKRPKLSEEVATQNQPSEKEKVVVEGVQAQPGRLIKNREPLQPEKPASPKFIVTLDGVPSPPGYGSDQEEAMEYIEEGQQTPKLTSTNLDKKTKKMEVQQRIARQPNNSDGEEEDRCAPVKQKIPERCKYWPACKNGDTCVYHHPTAPCKAFPKCKFAEKCLFIHPNCKYDAKCTKPDCPYTHASRRQPVQPSEVTAPVCHVAYCRYDTHCTKEDCPYMHGSQLNPMLLPKKILAPASSSAAQQCKFFPACKKMECPFYHPKPCRYNTQCQRTDCTFYHPASSVPPRHALKWTRSQTSE
ncbi:zinc finger CCCH domain-containing protein 14 isoform X3 [Pleurodeles waltl]|uniref:zinc finger CCCH domain-containing protein 14 isoform X3 n=1 Tax=Pleurodeles waltl TaxID=8319 RepID=UPI0037095CC6